MLLKRVEITHISPCLADTAKIKLKAILSDDISEAMPYLNAVLKNATYNHHAPNLSLYKDFRLITLYPREMTMIKALNTTDAHQVIEWLRELINETYARRGEIEPDYERKRKPHPLQLYIWLPRTNCRRCGEQGCLAFALLLFCGRQKLRNCAPLFESLFQEQKEVLTEMARVLGYEDINASSY